MQNKVFFSQPTLDEWLSDGKVDLKGSELTILEEERRYQIAEALYVIREVSGTPDVHQLVGRVKPTERLTREGAEVFDTSIILGENAYDVVPGWLGVPIGEFEARRSMPRAPSATFEDEPKTDEDMLARFVLKSLNLK